MQWEACDFDRRKADSLHNIGQGLECLLEPWAKKTCPERVAYEGSSCGLMTAQAIMYFYQELSSLLFVDTPLVDSGSALFVQFTLMHFEGFRAPNYASSFILIVGKLLPIKVGQEWFGLGGDNRHDHMSRGCYLDIRTSDSICIVFDSWGCDQVRIAFSALTLPHNRWIKEPFHKGVGWHRVV